jgi:hypothetical protein
VRVCVCVCVRVCVCTRERACTEFAVVFVKVATFKSCTFCMIVSGNLSYFSFALFVHSRQYSPRDYVHIYLLVTKYIVVELLTYSFSDRGIS